VTTSNVTVNKTSSLFAVRRTKTILFPLTLALSLLILGWIGPAESSWSSMNSFYIQLAS